MRAYYVIVLILLLGAVPPAPAAGSCTGNDCFAGAVGHFGRSIADDNFGATMESGEPAPCSMTRSVWYTLTPRTSGNLTIYLTGVEWFASMALYTGSSLDGLTLARCGETWMDPEGTPTSTWFPPDITMPCVIDQPFQLQLGGMANASGSFELHAYGCAFDATLPTEPRWCTHPSVPCPKGARESIELGWVGPQWDGGQLTDVEDYRIERAAGGCSGAFSHLATVHSTSWWSSYIDTGLAPGATYCYRVAAINDAGTGPFSTLRSATVFPLARPPVTLTVAPNGDGALRAAWSRSADDVAGKPAVLGYRVYASDAESGPFDLITQTARLTFEHTETGLGRDRARFYRITTLNAGGEGDPSVVATATTPHLPGAPRQVTAAFAVAVAAPVAFRVSWEAPLDAPWLQGYEIWRSLDGATPGVLAGTVGPAATSFVDSARSPLVDYHYTVKAWNPAGVGPASDRACATWPMDTPFAACG